MRAAAISLCERSRSLASESTTRAKPEFTADVAPKPGEVTDTSMCDSGTSSRIRTSVLARLAMSFG